MNEYVQGPPSNARPVSKGLYLTLIILGESLGLVLLGPTIYFAFFEPGLFIMFLSITSIASIVGGIAFLVLLYKSWYSIQDGNTRTTPGKAVGFLFIPFFSLYWMFVAYYGLAVEYNKFIKRNNIEVTELSEGLFLSHSILTLLFPFALAVIDPIIANQMCNGINNLAYYVPPVPVLPPHPEPNPTIPLFRTPTAFAVLIAESGPLRGQTFKLVPRSSYIIGRAGDIKIPEEDKTTSREHARVREENGNFVIYDMGSTNHIYINGERADRKVLLDGDKIKIGQNVFRFQFVRNK